MSFYSFDGIRQFEEEITDITEQATGLNVLGVDVEGEFKLEAVTCTITLLIDGLEVYLEISYAWDGDTKTYTPEADETAVRLEGEDEYTDIEEAVDLIPSLGVAIGYLIGQEYQI